jgi:hypothetical protein
MFERYTQSARRILFYARYEASQVDGDFVEPEHLVLGMLRESEGFAPVCRVVTRNEVDVVQLQSGRQVHVAFPADVTPAAMSDLTAWMPSQGRIVPSRSGHSLRRSIVRQPHCCHSQSRTFRHRSVSVSFARVFPTVAFSYRTWATSSWSRSSHRSARGHCCGHGISWVHSPLSKDKHMGSGGFGFVVSPVLMLLIVLVVALMLVGGVWMMMRR